MPPKRKYELKKRAEEMAETHLRITEAAIDLHGTVGPSRTTLSAVAKRAGVERRTLYRHFPNEADLFAACSTHYFAANPWPDLGNWRAIRDPQQRLERALDELYAYYERTEPMFSNVLRDAEVVDFAREAMAPLRVYLEEAAEILMMGRQVRGRRRLLLRGAVRHALAFSTWQSLIGQRHRAIGCGEAHHRTRRSRLVAVDGPVSLAKRLRKLIQGRPGARAGLLAAHRARYDVPGRGLELRAEACCCLLDLLALLRREILTLGGDLL